MESPGRLNDRSWPRVRVERGARKQTFESIPSLGPKAAYGTLGEDRVSASTGHGSISALGLPIDIEALQSVSAMAVSERSRDGPRVAFPAPQDRAFGTAFARVRHAARLEVAEAVLAPRQRTVVLDRSYFQCHRYQFSLELAADVVFRLRDHGVAGPGDAAPVVKELDCCCDPKLPAE